MRRWLLAFAALPVLALLVWFGGVGPMAMLPGGILWGETAPVPNDWSFTDSVAEVQLEVRRGGVLPWSVTTWVMSDGPRLFIGASECDRVWTDTVKAHPDVRVRIDGRIYSLRMELEERPEVGAVVAPIILHKYMGIAVESARFAGTSPGCLFRLEARS